MLTGSATFSGGSTLAFSTTPSAQYLYLDVDRNDSDGLDFLALDAEAQAPGVADSTNLILTVLQAPDASTHDFLFSDPDGGLSFHRPLNLAADGVFAVGNFGSATVEGSFDGSFGVTALSVKDVSAVPEPAGMAMMLAGVALVGATLRRRRPTRALPVSASLSEE